MRFWFIFIHKIALMIEFDFFSCLIFLGKSIDEHPIFQVNGRAEVAEIIKWTC